MQTNYYVGRFTLVLINAAIAQSKYRSAGGWFVASLFIGPLATFLLVVLYKPQPPKP